MKRLFFFSRSLTSTLLMGATFAVALSGCGNQNKAKLTTPTQNEKSAVLRDPLGTQREQMLALQKPPAPVRHPNSPIERVRVLPPVSEVFDDWNLSQTAADALGRIGEPAVPQLVQLLSDRDPLVRRQAIRVLGRIGPQAHAAVPALVKLLHENDEDIRKDAARTLGQIGPGAGAAVGDLIELMRTQPVP